MPAMTFQYVWFLLLAEKKREERTTSVGSSATTASTSAQGGVLTPTSKPDDAVVPGAVPATGASPAVKTAENGGATTPGATTTAAVGATTAVAVSAATAEAVPAAAPATAASLKQIMSMPSASAAAGGWVSIARASIEKSSSLLSDRVTQNV